MKIEIWDEDQKEEEQPLRLRLVRVIDGVELRVVNATGSCCSGHLLKITDSGALYLEPSISHRFGLKLDSHGCLEVSK